MIENYQKKINTLILLGKNLYNKKISTNYKLVEVNTLNIKYGISLPSSKRKKGIIPLLASNGISDYVSEANAKNAIVFGCRGTLGNVFYQEGNAFILNTAFYINDPKDYGNLFFALKNENGLTLYQSGAAQPQITIDAIKSANLKLPCDNALNLILDLISNYNKSIMLMKKIKEIFLKKYFS